MKIKKVAIAEQTESEEKTEQSAQQTESTQQRTTGSSFKALAILFGLSLVAGIVLIMTFFNFSIKQINQSLISPEATFVSQAQPTSYSAEIAPSLSLRGQITTLSGDVSWQSRIATDAAKINQKQTIQQGESLQTGDNGSVAVLFTDQAMISLFAKTQVDFVQTLPADLVLVLDKGSIDVQKTGGDPLTIRALHLLIDQKSGELGIVLDPDQQTVAINANKGTATVAYNDVNLVSQVVTIPQGKQYYFDDQTRIGRLR